jgi:carbonic anhydrase
VQKLLQGIHRFQRSELAGRRPLFEKLVSGQSPEALFITCSDSRINPHLLTEAEPGDLFILRNAGNIVPPYGSPAGGEAGTIEYAVRFLGVKHIVVCGHSHCGAMAGLLDPASLSGAPAVAGWLQHAEPTRRIIQDNYADLDPAARIKATVQENVLCQLESLRTHPAVASALARGDLQLHGWVYKFESGEVFAFDPDEGQFVPLAETTNLPKPRGSLRHRGAA